MRGGSTESGEAGQDLFVKARDKFREQRRFAEGIHDGGTQDKKTVQAIIAGIDGGSIEQGADSGGGIAGRFENRARQEKGWRGRTRGIERESMVNPAIQGIGSSEALRGRFLNQETHDVGIGRLISDGQDSIREIAVIRRMVAGGEAIIKLARGEQRCFDDFSVTGAIERDGSMREPAGGGG